MIEKNNEAAIAARLIASGAFVNGEDYKALVAVRNKLEAEVTLTDQEKKMCAQFGHKEEDYLAIKKKIGGRTAVSVADLTNGLFAEMT